MMNDQSHIYNWELCQMRHKDIEEDMKALKQDVQKVSNRFIILLTMLSMTLLGVAANLLIQLVGK